MSTAIAIIGTACRYPDADSPRELWENVLAQRQAFRRLPPERLRLEDYFSNDRRASDAIYSTEAALIEGYRFDREAFRVPLSTYRSADLTHWLALDVASQALASAGFEGGEGLPKDATGVLLGNTLTGEFSRAELMRLRWPYVRRVLGEALVEEGWPAERREAFLGGLEASYKQPFHPVGDESLAGGLANTIAGRICNYFDLHGGGYTVDGACASSLLATAQACSALAAHDLDLALAGGVDLSIDPFELVGFAKVGALSPGGMRVYDARSRGFIPGEGCGIVVLMREEDARAEGRPILGIIRGWGISSDGSGGISRPEAEGQALAIRRAYRRAGYSIASVGYFEGHGTGTQVGDATELAALETVRREAGECPPAALGSVKANIGHTKAAAGVAGLIKALEATRRRILPPHTGFQEPHPELAGGTLQLLRRPEPWAEGEPARASVSAMGFGGINVHLTLEGEASSRPRVPGAREARLGRSVQDAELFLLSADDVAGFVERLEVLAARSARLSQAELTDLAARLERELGRGRLRAAVVAASPAELAARLELLAGWLEAGDRERLAPEQGVFLGARDKEPGIAFLFSGQGSPAHQDGGAWSRRFPWVAELYRSTSFAGAADGVATEVAQPAIITASLAGLRLLDELGLAAHSAVGHSLGELSALYWAGALEEGELLELAAARGRAMADGGESSGAMAGLRAGAEAVEGWLGGRESVVIACYNGPSRTVISGPREEVEAVLATAAAAGAEGELLRVSHAFHSPLVAPCAEEVGAAAAAVRFRPPRGRVLSTVTGAPLDPEADLAELLLEQVCSPVRFEAALAAARGVDLWIEVGPGRALAGMAAEVAAAPALSVDAGSESLAGLLSVVGAAFALGAEVETHTLFADRFHRPLELDREPVFLVNPCERAPVPEATEAEPPLRPPVAAAAEAGLPAATRPATASALEVVRALISERTALPPEAVQESDRLLSDLHLSSIVVSQLAGEASRRMGLTAPAAPTDYANATVGGVAEALEELRDLGGGAGDLEARLPAGVDTWVRAFRTRLRPEAPPRPEPAAGGGSWRVFAPPGHPLAESLGTALESSVPAAGLALCLPSDPEEGDLDLFLSAAASHLETPAERFLVLQQGGGGGGFARTLHLETGVPTVLLDLPPEDPRALGWASTEARAGRPFVEAVYDRDGERRVPALSALPLAPAGAPALGSEDVLLASGGGKGIAAECALALGLRCGCRLAILGRSRPDASPELAANLERMRAAGLSVLYLAADVGDAEAVARAAERIRDELGPVTALLHGAGINRPKRLAELSAEDFRSTLSPKLGGLRHLLAAVESDHLRLVVTFGSVIARTGLPGEAHYALANEWLAREAEGLARRRPDCRVLDLDWSVWAGVGMGERLGSVDSLLAKGITPISIERGVETLLALLGRDDVPTSVVVSGRFGEIPTLEIERPELPLLRFLEEPRVHLPDVELVVDCRLSAATDPYLADHVYQGEPLFPAVLGLEAMAQVATALAGVDELPTFEEIAFERPVAVGGGESHTIRLAALRRDPETIEVVLRSEATSFQADHFRALCRFSGDGAAAAGEGLLAALEPRLNGSMAIRPERDLYDRFLFQSGRFRRLDAYRLLRARECLAEITPDGSAQWFGRFQAPTLLLGDPGARDAALHGIQACVPHATVLPVGVDRLRIGYLDPEQPWRAVARERRREGDLFVYDLEIRDREGRLAESWEGLRLRAVDSRPSPEAWPAELLSPFVERRLEEISPGEGAVEVAFELGHGEDRESRSEAALGHLLGEGVALGRRPDGKREAGGGEGAGVPSISVAHAHPLVLVVAGEGPVGCDLEPVSSRPEAAWADLLGAEGLALARLLAAEGGEDADTAATRVWTAAESLVKAGAGPAAPLTLREARADGWVLLGSGRLAVATYAARVQDLGEPVVLAVLHRSSDTSGGDDRIS